MTEANEQQAPPNGDPTPQVPTNDGITLSREEYSQMTTQLAVAQAQLERILEERQQPAPQQPQQPATPGKDINSMTNAEMFEMITQTVNSQVAQPLLNTIMQLAIKEEVRDVQERYPDFKDFKKDVYTIAEKNTHMSIEQAYLLAKATKQGTAPPPAAPPQAPPPPPPPGEKPGVTTGSLEPEAKLTARQAAEQAMKALKYT
jgi:hypothetical protein